MTKKRQSKSNLYNCFIVKSQQLNQLYNSSRIDFSLTFNVGFNVLIYSASLIFLFMLLLQLPLRILKSSFHTWVCWLSLAYFSRYEILSLLLWSIIRSLILLSVFSTYVSLQVTLGQRLKYTMLCLDSNLVLSFTENCVESFVPSYVIYIFLLDNNRMPCFTENGSNNSSFVSLLSVVLVCGSLVILTLMFWTVLDE